MNAGLRSLLVKCSLEGVVATVEWWDEQQAGDRAPGPGVLVEMIRRGGVKTRAQRLSSNERNRLYGEGICEWLRANFPDLITESGNPHPAAFVEVTHLHQEFGKGSLTKAQHGPRIRAAVAAFAKRWAPGGEMGPREMSGQAKEEQ